MFLALQDLSILASRNIAKDDAIHKLVDLISMRPILSRIDAVPNRVYLESIKEVATEAACWSILHPAGTVSETRCRQEE